MSAVPLAPLRTACDRLVPGWVRRIVGFDLKGLVSLALWVARRRHGVPDGATAASYSRAQTSTLLMLLFAMVVELVVVDIALRGFGAPAALRTVILVSDGYAILTLLAVIAACVTRPHVFTAGEVRIRYGAFFDLRVPLDLIIGVRVARRFDEKGLIRVEGERLRVAVCAETNLVMELAEPITAVRPFGRRAEVRVIEFFADAPGAFIAVPDRPFVR